MRWDAVSAPSEQIALARELVRVTSSQLWGTRSLREASRVVADDEHAWRKHFPDGARSALWFISEVSDASMASAFIGAPANNMSEVIVERFAQNSDLKPFVRRVMLFDILHPLQAISRMQRTARVMISCLAGEYQQAGSATISALNLIYTFIVFVWLLDRDGIVTRRTTAVLMRLIRL